MLAWIVAIMIGICFLVCGVIIAASLYQIFQVFRHRPRKPNTQYTIVSNGTGVI